MVSELLDLAERMEKVAGKIDEEANRIKKDAANAIARDLIVNTPVDTSRALSNWIVNADGPQNFSILPHVKGSNGSTYGVSSSMAIAAAMRAIEDMQPGQAIYITNNLRYIRRLNEGWSKQQPAGFVERAKHVGRGVVRRSKLRLN